MKTSHNKKGKYRIYFEDPIRGESLVLEGYPAPTLKGKFFWFGGNYIIAAEWVVVIAKEA